MLHKSGINLSQKVIEFINCSNELFIFVPYIKLDTLSQLLKSSSNCKSIVVRWEAKDLLRGSSDLEIYPFCKERNIALYRNARLHLKAFSDSYARCLLGSANISSRALNLPEYDHFNYEIATTVENLSIEDRHYFYAILNESTLINDSIFEQIKSQIHAKKEDIINDMDFELKLDVPDKDFLISSLPMSYDVDTFLHICQTKEAHDDIEMNCAMHDLALYNLSFHSDLNSLKESLTIAFFSHPFIKAFLKTLEETGEIYFGTAKEWIQKNCTNVPIPRRWEITENIQILYRWIVDLGEGKILTDRPNYSERLFLTSNRG